MVMDARVPPTTAPNLKFPLKSLNARYKQLILIYEHMCQLTSLSSSIQASRLGTSLTQQ